MGCISRLASEISLAIPQERRNAATTVTSHQSQVWLLGKLLRLVLLFVLPGAAQAQFTYTTNNGTITITGYTGPAGALTIPSTLDGLPVTVIGAYAFSQNTSLTAITIPGTVTYIDTYAFQSCRSLRRVIIDDGLQHIGFGAFISCTSLTNVTIPNTVLAIDTYAFYNCASLATLTIPNTVTGIGNGAFSYCTSLVNISIPSSVTSIGIDAFGGCDKLEAIVVDQANPVYSSFDGVLLNKSQTTLLRCPGGKRGAYAIPGGVSAFDTRAFSYCQQLISVTIPNTVKSISEQAFFYCSSLNGVSIPDKVTAVGSAAFAYCSSLANVSIGKGATSIGSRAFASCSGLIAIVVDTLNPAYSSYEGVLFDRNQTTLIQCPAGKTGSYAIPPSVRTIGSSAFEDCLGLTRVTIPNSVTSIKDSAFFMCSGLGTVTIPKSVTSLGDRAFCACFSLLGVYFGGNAPSFVSSYLFYNANQVTAFYLPGTTGWGSTYAGRPAVLWNPSIQTASADSGVRGNPSSLNVTGTTNIPIVVEGCTNLATASWIALQTCTLTNGSVHFSDPAWTNYPARFYRIRSP
jgi:hypothetical protein